MPPKVFSLVPDLAFKVDPMFSSAEEIRAFEAAIKPWWIQTAKEMKQSTFSDMTFLGCCFRFIAICDTLKIGDDKIYRLLSFLIRSASSLSGWTIPTTNQSKLADPNYAIFMKRAIPIFRLATSIPNPTATPADTLGEGEGEGIAVTAPRQATTEAPGFKRKVKGKGPETEVKTEVKAEASVPTEVEIKADPKPQDATIKVDPKPVETITKPEVKPSDEAIVKKRKKIDVLKRLHGDQIAYCLLVDFWE